ncbi:S1C family serine protease [Pustulibacterium marinum]|nr:S1C family serine protease [Pustulibacterium marinum]
MKRDTWVKQIKIEQEGFKDTYLIHYQKPKSPLYIMSWVPFGLLFYPPLTDFGPKSWNYKKDVYNNKIPQKISKRNDEQKYVFIESTSFDIDEDDFKVKIIKNRQYTKGKDKFKDITGNNEKLEYDNTVFTSSLNEILYKYNYIDTTKTIIKDRTNTKYINATIKKIEFNNIYDKACRGTKRFLTSQVAIEWEITDFYGRPEYTESIEGASGDFKFSKDEEQIKKCLQDAISSSFLKFMGNEAVDKLIDKNNVGEEIELEQIVIKNSTTPTDIKTAMSSTVTIKSNLGHGSGLIIGDKGYIVTNLHVIATADSLQAITNNGKELSVSVLRTNPKYDLALLKVDDENHVFENSFTISSQKNYEIGDEIFAVGTPNSIELGQSISKGIISGIRVKEEEELSYIQTDASINSGNSGGPLISKSGELLGVVNAKLLGVGVEGIGFAIPVEIIKEALSIEQD